jgi:hypothetical protein
MTRKKIVFIATTLFLGLHFLLTFLYCSPSELIGPRLSSYARYYTYPVFQQGWALFAPEPQQYGKTLEYRYRQDNEWQQWIVPAQRYYDGHVSKRHGADSEKYFLAQQTALYLWIEKDRYASSDLSELDFYPDTYGYMQANYYAAKSRVLNIIKRGGPVDSVQVRLKLVKSMSEEVSYTDFPPASYDWAASLNDLAK